MANERYGNKYVVLIGHETSYGTQQKTPTANLYSNCVMKESTNQIETGIKNGNTEKWKNELLAGTKSGTVTLSGELSLEDTSSAPTGYGALLAAFFMRAGDGTFDASDYTTPSAGSTESFTIYQYFTADDNYDYATGCVPESLEITGSSGEAITFSMTFRAKEITRETEDASPNELSVTTTYSDITPLLFQHASLDKCLGATDLDVMNSFTLTLNFSYVDDAMIYNNSQTKDQDIFCRFTGNLTVDLNYSDVNSKDAYDNIMSADLKDGEISLYDSAGSNSWKFTTNGKVTDYDRPDPDRCIFANSFTKELLGDDAPTSAITISYNAGT